MKKIFTLIAAMIAAITVNAETLISYPTSQDGITVNGTTTFDAVKIKTNTTSISGIKFPNSYTSESASNGNNAELTVEGGFKAGDKIVIAGAFNNTDETKVSKVDLFTLDGTTPTVLWTSSQFINGRLVNDDPVEETYTLEADAEKLYLGRNGSTATFVTTLKVERESAGITEQLAVKFNANGVTYNLAGQKVGADFKGIVIKNGVKVLNK